VTSLVRHGAQIELESVSDGQAMSSCQLLGVFGPCHCFLQHVITLSLLSCLARMSLLWSSLNWQRPGNGVMSLLRHGARSNRARSSEATARQCHHVDCWVCPGCLCHCFRAQTELKLARRLPAGKVIAADRTKLKLARRHQASGCSWPV
jgi:hypothetical protein